MFNIIPGSKSWKFEIIEFSVFFHNISMLTCDNEVTEKFFREMKYGDFSKIPKVCAT